MSQNILQLRTVERLVKGQPTSDGAGVKLTRVLTHEWQQRLDPFLAKGWSFAEAALERIGCTSIICVSAIWTARSPLFGRTERTPAR